MTEPSKTWTPPGAGERYDPLPGFLRLPLRGWRMLGRWGRIVLVAVAVAGLLAIVLSWPSVEREKRAGERERAREETERRAAQRRAIAEDQRPRRATLPARVRTRISTGGGLTDPAAASLAGGVLESAMARDVRQRVQAGTLDGPVLSTSCDPVRARSRLGANYNCFVTIGRRRSVGRTYTSGYRFSARAQLPAGTLAWCKENPRPLHPTSYVITVPLSSDCR